MTKYIPVLGSEGWVSEGQKKLDQALADLYASDASQTFFFTGEVASMAKVVQKNQGRLSDAIRDLTEMLTNYFNNYFFNVEVIVYEYATNDIHRGELVLAATMDDEDGKSFELHEVMTNKGSLVRKVLDYQYESPP